MPDYWLITLPLNAVYEWARGLDAGQMRYLADFGERPPPFSHYFQPILSPICWRQQGDVYLLEDGEWAWTVIGHCDFGRLPYWVSPRFDAHHAIYAADDTMAYVSTDRGGTWIEAGEGLPTCEYGGPECGFKPLRAERFDDGYNVYALVLKTFTAASGWRVRGRIRTTTAILTQ